MNKKMPIARTLVALSLSVSATAFAGALETNLSGWFLKGERSEIAVTGLNSGGFNFRLSSGNITPGQGCANGPGDCMTLWGWATRTEIADEFLYANENGECAFYFRNEPKAIVIHGLKGTCGTDAQNRNALKSVDGAYSPRQ
ncbi:MAG: hypothetical protein ACKODT_05680 [Fluviibacter sp.]